MERQDLPPTDKADLEFDKTFKPKGAIAFFLILVVLGIVIWYGIYYIMLQRV
ncbi:cytochrome c oxidase subunit 2A [Flavisolibacter ginsenosidimutans]|uniref:Cytochrome c oxidase subunit 2A n=1 Tax=Flavisolibacter ginsenosidimutans TaxID=661481 RepID=A0A5B8UFK3_9BACT|nr:cytochrome c oxidase subunit 2A [Flavisolibacter ginsenosidimutans]QEC55447.1 cytochrome c oxidase subunit 2A [Flavisolibacter ginsenosidimutans]